MKALALVFALCTAPLQAAVTAEPDNFIEFPDLIFAKTPETDLFVDVFVPKEVKNPPLVLYIHGGGWKTGDRKTPFVRSLAAQGFAVASIEYRFSTQAKFPAQIFDCKGAVRWLRANAGKFGYDAGRIAAVGESAGGQLAVLLGTSAGVTELEGNVGGNLDQSSKVQAVVDYFGVTDFLLRVRTQPDKTEIPGSVAYDLFGGRVSQNERLARLASGVEFISKDDPPLLAIHGDADTVVLPDQSERIVLAYRKQGLEAKFIIVPGGVHAGERYYASKLSRSVFRFLTNRLQVAAGG